MPTSRALLTVAARLPPRLHADARRLVAGLEHHREPPGRHVGQRLDVGELDAPVAGDVDLGDRSAPALALVEFNQPFGQHLARQHLILGVERGAHRQAAFVQLFLAIAFVELAPHFFGEIFRREGVRGGRLLRHAERRALGGFGLRDGDEAVLCHLVDDPVAPLERALARPERVIVVRRLRQRRQIGGLLHGQLVDAFVEISERGRGDAIGAEAEIDLVQVKLEDLVLRVSALDLERQQRFLDLARERNLV